MAVAGMAAGDIGVEALDLVGEPGFLEEVQRAINGRRLGRAFPVEIGKQVIGLCRLVALQQETQHLAADPRHALALPRDQRLRFIQERIDILRAAGRIGVDVIMRSAHGPSVVRFAANVKTSVPSFAGERP